jgi:hypothetical protein
MNIDATLTELCAEGASSIKKVLTILKQPDKQVTHTVTKETN